MLEMHLPHPSLTSLLRLTGVLALAVAASAQPLPPAAHDNIHTLFDQHAKVRRDVKLTATGYEAVTESDDPKVAETLRAHVAQMRERLGSGLPVRRWDPAYEEMVRHHEDLELKVEPTARGLRVVMTGRTPAAIKIAQNHAQIVSKFAAHGWAEHDVSHPAVAGDAVAAASTSGPGACCRANAAGGEKGGAGCCGQCGQGKCGESAAPAAK